MPHGTMDELNLSRYDRNLSRAERSYLGLEPMRTIVLLLITAHAFSGLLRASEPRESSLSGIWFCDTVNGYRAYRARRSVLIVRNNHFVMVTGTGVTKSTFTTDQQEINIERYDERPQPGIYDIDGITLHLSLGDADGIRPSHDGHKRGETQEPGPPHSHYRFTRLPTPEGMEILRTALNDEHKLNTIISESVASTTQ